RLSRLSVGVLAASKSGQCGNRKCPRAGPHPAVPSRVRADVDGRDDHARCRTRTCDGESPAVTLGSLIVTTSNPITALLLDIEGTTTPIDFVYKVLFPYARARVGDYLANNVASPIVEEEIAGLIELNKGDARRGLEAPRVDGSIEETSLDKIVAYFHWLMDRDSKATPLKSIQ